MSRIYPVLLILMVGAYTLESQASRLQFKPYVTTGIYYSDNIGLQPEGLAEEDTVLEVMPGFLLDYPGRSFSTRVQYRAQGLYYRRNDAHNEVYSQLDANALASAADQWFLRLNSALSQQTVDPDQPVTTSNIPITGNRTDVRRNTANPYWAGVYGNGIRAGIGYSRTDVAYGQQVSGSLEDSDLKVVNAYIGNTPERVHWMLNYSDRKVEYNNSNTESSFENVSFELGIPLAGRTSLLATVGHENNDYPIPAGTERPEGGFWTVGLRWVNPGTGRFEVSAGRRFFGDTYWLLLERRGRHLETQLTYREELTTDNELQQLTGEGLDGEVSSATNLGRLTTQVYLNRRAQWSLTYRRSKTAVILTLGRDEREFQTDGSRDITTDGRLRLNWRLAPRTTLFLQGRRWHDQFRGGAREDRLVESRLGLERQIGPRTSFDLSIRGANRDSNQPGADYRERGATINMTWQF